MVIFWVLLAVIGCERAAELIVSQRHATATLRQGGVEYGRGHFPVMVALHAGLLAGCVAEPLASHRAFVPALAWPMIVVVAAANTLRWWCVATLGERWTARVIVVPGLPPASAHQATGVYLLAWAIFTVYMTVASLRVSGAVAAVFVALSLTFILLAAGEFAQSTALGKVGGWLGLITAVIAWYASFAGVTNGTWRRQVLPTWPLRP